MKFRLSTEDTERLGLPEVLEFDWGHMSVADARALKATTGLPVAGLLAGWREADPDAVLAVVWLAARRAGVELEWSGLELNLYGIRGAEDEADERGKGSSSKPATSPRKRTNSARSSATSAR